MIKPPIPENEKERLNALYSLNVLDTAAEERFDRITRIAKKLFDVPIALVSLVDANRQWFKSQQGLDGTETSRDESFCGHAILKDDMMVVEDATLDQRFHDNPFVLADPNIKFYLGCPLKVNNQYNVGTLCLIDKKPRQFTEAEQETIRDLGDMVQAELQSLHLSTSDELTTLSNRRGFILISNHVFNLCQRTDSEMSMLFFDLDKFKHINDAYGHAEGDYVLKTFAKILLDSFRHSDVIARIGGDEFCVLCSDVTKEDAERLIERFHHTLDEFNHSSNKEYKIEYSIGHIEYEKAKHQSIEDMISEADTKMYKHKKR